MVQTVQNGKKRWTRGTNVIPCHFVLATKRGPDGEKLKLRARLVANGQRQQYGIDFFETFAPTANMSTICRRPGRHLYESTSWISGLKQAGFEWAEELAGAFRKMGFSRSQVDQAVYFKRTPQEHIVITVSVDDMAVTANHKSHILRFKSNLREFFEISDLGEHYPLSKGLCQHHCRTVSHGRRKECADPHGTGHLPYQRAIGSLMYAATSTRPDIAFAVATLSQFMRNPRRAHLGSTDAGIEAFVDADWASQPHRHSMSGYIVLLNGGPVSWSARKQPIIALQLLLGELYDPPSLPTPIFCDNQAAIALASTGKFQSRTKHIDLRYHFVRSHVKNGTFELLYCPTDNNIADAFTKALPRPRLQKLRGQMSLACARGGVLTSERSETMNTEGSEIAAEAE